jgi:hypothetical protein
MAMRIKRLADIVETGETEAGEERHRLVVHRPHSFQKSYAVVIGVIERSLQVIDDRKPFGGDGGSLQRTHTGQLALVALPKIVEVRQRPSEGQIVRLRRCRNIARLRLGPDLLRTGIVSTFTASR